MINLKLNTSKWGGNHEIYSFGEIYKIYLFCLFLGGEFPANFRQIWGTSEPHLLVEAASAGEV